MIVKVKKILIYGLEKEVDNFFKKIQKKGIIEFIGQKKIPKEITLELKKYLQTIKILKKETYRKKTKEKTPNLLITF